MRQLVSTIAFVFFIFTAIASANDEIADGRAMIQSARDEIVRTELHMTDEEAAGFWPLYSQYRVKHNEVMDRYGELIAEYVRRYDDADLSDEYADEMIATYFEVKSDLLTVQQEFLPKFRAVLPALKVARFYQLENKITAEIDAQLAVAVPLVDPS
jgi:hypothetical protein